MAVYNNNKQIQGKKYYGKPGDKLPVAIITKITQRRYTLTFTVVKRMNLRKTNGRVFFLNKASEDPKWIVTWENASSRSKQDLNFNYITKVVYDKKFAKVQPASTYRWFYNMDMLEEIRGIEYLDTSRVTDMQEMFYGCSGLCSIDLSHFNTKKVKTMRGMFSNCKKIRRLNLNSFKAYCCEDMSYMFSESEYLKEIEWRFPVSQNVKDMSYMFNECHALEYIEWREFWTNEVRNMHAMFFMTNLCIIDLSDFNTSKVTDMGEMFAHCGFLKKLDVSNLDTSHVANMSGMFRSCLQLENLDLSSFDTSNVTDMREMFSDCHAMKYLDISNFNLSKASTERFISGCENLRFLKVGNNDLRDKPQEGNEFWGNSLITLDNPEHHTATLLVTDSGFDKSVLTAGAKTQDDEDCFEWRKGLFFCPDSTHEPQQAIEKYLIGYYFDKSKDIDNHFEKAVLWYKKAAAQDLADAQFSLGSCYKNGNGVTKDYEKACEYYQKAVDKNNRAACNALGVMYANGEEIAKDSVKAKELFEKGYGPDDCFNLGLVYLNGDGVEADYNRATELFRNGAYNQDPFCQFNLSCCYANGLGVEKEANLSFYWCLWAARNGLKEAQYVISLDYEDGYGTKSDYVKSYEWLLKSAAQGYELAKKRIKEIDEEDLDENEDEEQLSE